MSDETTSDRQTSEGTPVASEATPVTKRDHALLIGDGWLLTAGAVSVGMALMVAVMGIAGSKAPSVVTEIGSSALLLVTFLGGVFAAWLLNGRRLSWTAVVGGVVGSWISGFAIFGVAGLSAVFGFLLSPVTKAELAGPIAMLAIATTGFVVLTVWLLVDGIRDLRASRAHVRLDWARIAAGAAFVLLTAVCIYAIYAQPGPEQGEAFIWSMFAGVGGAGVMAGADLSTWLGKRQGSTKGSAAAPTVPST